MPKPLNMERTMIDQFSFKLSTQTYYGFGYSRKLGELLQERNFKNVVLMVHEGVYENSEYFQEIKSIIESNVSNLRVEVLRGSEEPDYDYLDEVTGKIRSINEIDVIVGIGGGSCLDIVKAVAVLVTNPGKGAEYRGFDKVKVPGVPVIAIPTTAGTGSEVTINAVFTNKQEQKKLGINGNFLNATYAILDAEWTLSCPYSVALSSGLDALVHAMESFMCQKANPLTRMFSKEGFRLVYSALPCLVDDLPNKEKRQQLLLGSYVGVIGLFNSGSGIAGALSYPLGVHFNMPHGIAGGIFILDVIEFNIEKGYFDFAEIFDLIEPGTGLSDEEKSRSFLEKLKELYKKLGVEQYLTTWGITKDNVEEVGKLMHPMQAAFDQNPVFCSAQEDALKFLKNHVQYS
jgi:alcohol dehydrogenase